MIYLAQARWFEEIDWRFFGALTVFLSAVAWLGCELILRIA